VARTGTVPTAEVREGLDGIDARIAAVEITNDNRFNLLDIFGVGSLPIRDDVIG
jgi:hypothetical protein